MSYTVDLQKIADELDFDLEDIEMLMEVFLESAEESLQTLKGAIDSNDLETIYSSAHAIKGSSANLTLNEISVIAKDIESNAREKNSFDYLEYYNRLERLIHSLKA